MNPIKQKILQAEVNKWANHIGHDVQFKDGSVGTLAGVEMVDEVLRVRIEGDVYPNFRAEDIYLCACQRKKEEQDDKPV